MRDSITEAYMGIVQQELDESKVRNAMLAVGAAGAIAGAALLTKKDVPVHEPAIQQAANQAAETLAPEHLKLAQNIKDRYKLSDSKAEKIVSIAVKHAHPVFPQAHHILAIAGIESSFNEKAKSKLRFDPAVGLMQIRPKVWNINPKELSTMEGQIKHGSHILHTYYTKTGSEGSAIKAYNVGITNFKSGKKREAAHRYHQKFKKELNQFEV